MQGLFKTFVGCDCRRESTTLRFEKHFYLTWSKMVFRGCKQTKFPFFINCVLKSHPCPQKARRGPNAYVFTTRGAFFFRFKDFQSTLRRNLRIWSQLLKKSLLENLIFCAVQWEWFTCALTRMLNITLPITMNSFL